MQRDNLQNPYTSLPTAGNPRKTEAWALTEAARRIRCAQEEQPFKVEDFIVAIRLNWRLWTIFQADVASPNCQMPTDIRQNILSLCNYIDQKTVDLISDPDPDKANVLISINREIAAGLFETPQQTIETGVTDVEA